MNGLEPLTCWLQISCSANWATSAYEFLLLRAARKLRFLARDAIAYTMKTSTSRQCKHSCVWCFHRARNLYSAKIEPHRRIHFYHLYCKKYKWDLQGSNLWPPACKADALPAELRSHSFGLFSPVLTGCAGLFSSGFLSTLLVSSSWCHCNHE